MKQLDSGTVGKQLAALIAAGEPIEITRYGRPVARLQPYPPPLEGIQPAREYMRTVESPTEPPRSWAQRQPAQAARDALLRKAKG